MPQQTGQVLRSALTAVLTAMLFGSLGNARAAEDLAAGFESPPAAARPWVYWFWLNGNITREGITADLEAMQRVGIGGVLIMEVDQGAPLGPVPFAGETWRERFRFVVTEAARLASKDGAETLADLAALRPYLGANEMADIPDPIGQSREVFSAVGSQIADLLPPILELCRRSG